MAKKKAKCTRWRKERWSTHVWHRSCGPYHARIVRSGIVKGRARLPWYNVRVFYARVGAPGRSIDEGTADTLALAKRFANPRLTGR